MCIFIWKKKKKSDLNTKIEAASVEFFEAQATRSIAVEIPRGGPIDESAEATSELTEGEDEAITEVGSATAEGRALAAKGGAPAVSFD